MQVLSRPNFKSRRILLKGLAEDMKYEVSFLGYEKANMPETKVYSGDTLMKAGILMPNLPGDFQAVLLHLTAI